MYPNLYLYSLRFSTKWHDWDRRGNAEMRRIHSAVRFSTAQCGPASRNG